MPSTFFGLNIAASGLFAQQTALSVIGNNIANSNNPVYKRQQAIMGARSAYPPPGGPTVTAAGQMGSGADVVAIQRMQDSFLDAQLRNTSQGLGRWQASKQSLDQVVSVLGEPSDTGLSNDLDKFWNAWQQLSLDPQNSAARHQVVQYGGSVATSLNGLTSQIQDLRKAQNEAIGSKVDSVNNLAEQLANVNDQIQRVSGAGNAPNDLLDQRDAILGQLSELAGVQVHGNGGASDVITLNGRTLVQGNKSTKLTASTDPTGQTTIQWADDGSSVSVSGGELAGMLDVQNNKIPAYLGALNDIAKGLMDGVNALHASGHGLDGSTGLDFFQGTGAGDIHVNTVIRDDPSKVAASGSGAAGDGTLALAISKLQSQALVGGATVGAAYRSLVSQNASDAANASDHMTAQMQPNQQVTLQQQSVSGVSLDQEMSDMLRYQQSYNASARMVSVMDDMLSTLINNLGLVGR